MDRPPPPPPDQLPDDLHALAIQVAQIQTQSICNATCTFCPYPSTESTLPQGRMDWELFEKVVEELTTIPTLKLASPMLQNEPIVDKRLPRVIAHFKARLPGVPTSINTNGSGLTPKVLDALIDAGLDELTFSLNALTRETFDRIHTKMSFDGVMANLRNLVLNHPPSLRVTVKGVTIRDSAIELAFPQRFSDLPELMAANGVDFRITAMSNRTGEAEHWDELVVLEDIDNQRHHTYCHDPFQNLNVLFNGDVLVCSSDWGRKTVLGNVARQTIAEIWNDAPARTRREGVAAARYCDMDACRDCSHAWHIEKNLGIR